LDKLERPWPPAERRAAPPDMGRETFANETRDYGIAMRRLLLHRLCGWCRQAPSFDRALRSVEEYSEKADNDQPNPAMAGLIQRAEQGRRLSEKRESALKVAAGPPIGRVWTAVHSHSRMLNIW
jgi:hypothetical protein